MSRASSVPPGYYDFEAFYAGDATHLNSVAYGYVTVTGTAVGLTEYTSVNTTSTQYGVVSYTAQITAVDSANNHVSGVTIDTSGTGLSFSPASPVTNADGMVVIQATPAKAGNLVGSFWIAGSSDLHTANFAATPAPLTVTASNGTRLYGAANPALSGTAMRLIGADTVTVTALTKATTASPVGTYAVTNAIGNCSDRDAGDLDACRGNLSAG